MNRLTHIDDRFRAAAELEAKTPITVGAPTTATEGSPSERAWRQWLAITGAGTHEPVKEGVFWRALWEEIEEETGQRGEWEYPEEIPAGTSTSPPVFYAFCRPRSRAFRVTKPLHGIGKTGFWVERSAAEGAHSGEHLVLVLSVGSPLEGNRDAQDVMYRWQKDGWVEWSRTKHGRPRVLLGDAPVREARTLIPVE